MYADIGQTLNHQRPSIPVLDDTPIEYAKINLSSHTNKLKHSVPPTTVPAKLNKKHQNGKLRLLGNIIQIIRLASCLSIMVIASPNFQEL